MVAQHTNTPDEPRRSLSPEAEQQLEKALRSFAAGSPTVTDELKAALRVTGNDARERNLRPEDLILVFKTIEKRIGVNILDEGTTHGGTFRARLIRALLEAYYER